MFSRSSGPVHRPALIAVCLFYFGVILAVVATAAHAGEYKMVLCAAHSGVGNFTTATNTTSPQNPDGIFDFNNYCFSTSDPAGDSGFLRISEDEPGGNAGEGAYGSVTYATPFGVHFRAAGGYTRQPNAFNDGWRTRFWALGLNGSTTDLLIQGSGVAASPPHWPASNIFGPHIWPYANYLDFGLFVYELKCVRPAGCDRSGFNASDANTFIFILKDYIDSEVSFADTNGPLLSGQWVKGAQWVSMNTHDVGSGLRFARLRVDGAVRHVVDYHAAGLCDTWTSPLNGEFARHFNPCAKDWYNHGYVLETATLTDGAHAISACTQDFGQYQGLNGTGGETCQARTIRVDNSAPGAPSGLGVTSANPARYLDRFGAQFSLPPDLGSPITKVHYQVLNAAGEVIKPEQVVSATNPTAIAGIEGPAKAGDYRLRVWLEDQVGFTGPAAVAPIPHDTTPPAAPQVLSVTAPQTPRSADGFDLRWQNILDAGAPIDAAHYQVLDGAGKVLVPSTTVTGENVQALGDLDTPGPAGSYQLRLWLSDAEGNVGAPVTAPLGYDCQRSAVGGATLISAALGGAVEQTLQQGQGTTLTGSVRSSSGPIATSPVCVFTRVETDSGREFLGIALTGGSGAYRFPLPAGPSREVIAIHRDGSRQLHASARLHTVVRPTLRARKTLLYNGESAFFEGEIPGPHNDNVTIVLQVRSGKGWLAFRRYRTRNDGHFEMTYPFRRTIRPTNYEMRAQVRETGSFPYVEGDSDPLTLRVLPESAKPKKRAANGRCAKKKRAVRRGPKHCPRKHRGHRRAPARH